MTKRLSGEMFPKGMTGIPVNSARHHIVRHCGADRFADFECGDVSVRQSQVHKIFVNSITSPINNSNYFREPTAHKKHMLVKLPRGCRMLSTPITVRNSDIDLVQPDNKEAFLCLQFMPIMPMSIIRYPLCG
jgi:hypothetical protein